MKIAFETTNKYEWLFGIGWKKLVGTSYRSNIYTIYFFRLKINLYV